MSEEYFEEEEFTGKVDRGTLWRIAQQGLKHWPLMIGFLVAIIGTAYVDSYLTFLSKRIIDEGIVAQDPAALRALFVQYGFTFVSLAGFVFVFIFSAGILGHRVQYDLRKEMFARLQELSLSYYNRTPLGWLMSRMTSDVTRVGELVSWGFLDITWGVANIVIATSFMMYINWRLGLIILALMPVLIWIATAFQKRILGEYRIVRRTNSQITGSYSESVNGVRVVKSLRREEANLGEFQVLTGEMYRSSFRAAWMSALFLPAVQIVAALGVSATVWLGGIQFVEGGMSIGSIQAFISYVTFMLWPIQEMARVFASMQQAVASAERIFSLIDEKPEIVDKENAVAVSHIRGDIEFDHVDFYYDANQPVLQDFHLTVKQGETIALVGPTGAGKSTIVNLLCRFYEPQKGQIRINGRDYTDMALHALQSRVGIVLQTPHLFSGTVMENLLYGRLDATEAEAIEAAHAGWGGSLYHRSGRRVSDRSG